MDILKQKRAVRAKLITWFCVLPFQPGQSLFESALSFSHQGTRRTLYNIIFSIQLLLFPLELFYCFNIRRA